MDNAFTSNGKRVFSAVLAGATILWAVGVAAIAVPQQVHAASAGDLVRGSLPTVYYYGYDGARYAFPNLKTYETWYTDFSGVSTISDSELASISLAGNAMYRPGSRWIKIESDPKTYAVSTSGVLHWIETEEVAVDFAGSDWNKNIDDVPVAFFDNYTIGTSLMSAEAFDGMLYMDGSDMYVALGGEKRMVTSEGASANHLRTGFFLDGEGIDDSALSAGSDVSSYECSLSDVAQTGCDVEDVEEEVVAGSVSVSLSSSTPAGATVPKGANAVEVLSVDLKAGSEASSVDSLAFHMNGIGAVTNISNAYLYEGSSRLTEARSVNSATRMVTFNNLGIDLSAGETRTMTLRVELSSSATAGDQVQFRLADDSAVVSEGSVSGAFPVTGNVFDIANVSTGSLIIEDNGTIINPVIGANDHTIGQFKVTASSDDANLESITLKIDNAADHSDFNLYYGTDLLSEGSYLGDKLVKFDFDEVVTIAEGSNKIFKVTADVGGEVGDTLSVYVDKAVDVVAYGDDYGFGMTAKITGYDGTTGDVSSSTLEGGDVTLAFNGPSASDITRNSQDQDIFEFSLTAQNEITVKDLDIVVYADDDGDNDATDGVEGGNDDDDTGLINGDNDGVADSDDEASIKDIKIVNLDTGAVLMGPMELDSAAVGGNDAMQTIDFTDDFIVEAGETLHLAVLVDVDNDITDGTEVAAMLDMSGLVLEDMNGDAVAAASIVPSSDLVGYNHKVTASSLSIQLASYPTSTTVVQGTSDVSFLGVSFTAGDASDVVVSSLTFTGHADDTNALDMTAGGAAGFQIEDYLSSCSLYEGDSLLDSSASVGTDGKVVFDGMNWTVDAGSSQTATLKCNVANPSDTDDDLIAFDLLTSSDVTAQDEDNNEPSTTLVPATGGDEGINDTNTADGTFDASVAITVTEKGSLAVAAASSTPNADYVLAGTTGNHVASYEFTATNEAFTVNTLTVSEEQAEDDKAVADSNAYANNISLVTLEYPQADGTTATKSVAMTGNEAKFSGLDMYVGEGDAETVHVYVDVPATDRVSGGAATSNEKMRLGFFVDTTNDDNFKATGLSSGITLDDDDTGAVGDDSFATDRIATFVVRETKPTVSLNASSPAGAGFIPGDQEVLRFNVAADSHEDVIVDEIVFALSSTDNAGTHWNRFDNDTLEGNEITAADFDLYDRSDLSTVIPATITLLDATGAVAADDVQVAYVSFDLTTPGKISAGSTASFSLYFDSTGASASSDDSVQVSLKADPIVSTYLTASDLNDGDGITVSDTTVTVDAGGSYSAGDLVKVGSEVMLVSAVAGNNLTVVRAYLGTAAAVHADNVAVDRLPSTFVWQDDGTTTLTVSTEELYGSYLVDSLTVTGGAMGF